MGKIETQVIKNYWVTPLSKQAKLKKEIDKVEKRAQLETYATANELIIYRGKAIKAEDYPCNCELEHPMHCQEEKNMNAGKGYRDGMCRCRCHTYYE